GANTGSPCSLSKAPLSVSRGLFRAQRGPLRQAVLNTGSPCSLNKARLSVSRGLFRAQRGPTHDGLEDLISC
ncbi:MAG: hypothetical protein AAFO75_07980, partial [Pseudomonadota bacterium]